MEVDARLDLLGLLGEGYALALGFFDWNRPYEGLDDKCEPLVASSNRSVDAESGADQRRASCCSRIATGLTSPSRFSSRYFFLGGVATFASEGAAAVTFGLSFFGFLVSQLLRT
jgi:hypothetical protein